MIERILLGILACGFFSGCGAQGSNARADKKDKDAGIEDEEVKVLYNMEASFLEGSCTHVAFEGDIEYEGIADCREKNGLPPLTERSDFRIKVIYDQEAFPPGLQISVTALSAETERGNPDSCISNQPCFYEKDFLQTFENQTTGGKVEIVLKDMIIGEELSISVSGKPDCNTTAGSNSVLLGNQNNFELTMRDFSTTEMGCPQLDDEPL